MLNTEIRTRLENGGSKPNHGIEAHSHSTTVLPLHSKTKSHIIYRFIKPVGVNCKGSNVLYFVEYLYKGNKAELEAKPHTERSILSCYTFPFKPIASTRI